MYIDAQMKKTTTKNKQNASPKFLLMPPSNIGEEILQQYDFLGVTAHAPVKSSPVAPEFP